MDTELCVLEDIPLAGARGFRIQHLPVVAVRPAADTVRVFLNRCPHLGVPLQWQEDRFLDNAGRFIQCSTHGALFDLSSGLCLQGPCRGESLLNIECRMVNGKVLIDSGRIQALNERMN